MSAEWLHRLEQPPLPFAAVEPPRVDPSPTPAAPAAKKAGGAAEPRPMLDTHAVARSLTAADFTPAQADALIDALRLAAEQGDHVTSDQFKAGQAEVRAEIAEVRTEIANLDTRLSTQIADLRTEQKTAVAALEARMATMETRLTWRIVGGVAAVGALLRFVG